MVRNQSCQQTPPQFVLQMSPESMLSLDKEIKGLLHNGHVNDLLCNVLIILRSTCLLENISAVLREHYALRIWGQGTNSNLHKRALSQQAVNLIHPQR